MQPNTDMRTGADSEDGQALVELMAVIIICTIMGFGIYEAGVLFHNVNVLNNATELAATHASRGAPWPVIQDVIYEEGTNMMDGAFLEQKLPDAGGGKSNIIVEIWNPQTNEPLVTQYEKNVEKFEPGQERIAPYIFWGQGYEIRVGTHLEIGIYVPFIRTFALSTEIVGSQTIQASSDSDRDGMFDQYEAEYGDWYADEGKGLYNPGDTWVHPVHRDGYSELDSDSTANIDGDTETDYEGCDLTIVMVCRGTTNNCDNSAGEEEGGIEVYNPQNQTWTLSKFTSENEGIIWQGSERVGPDEYAIISNDEVDADSEYGDTGDSIDVTPDTTFNIPLSGNQGFKIFDANNAVCDRVGFYESAPSLSSEWYETAQYDHGILTDLEFRRKKFDGSIPVDSGDNSEDFTGISDYAVRSEYEIESVYDYDNDGFEDKFDPNDSSSDTQNLLRMNPIVGPVGWPDDVP